MKKSQLWSITKTHSKECYNDVDIWGIVNLNGDIIAKFGGLCYDRDTIELVVNAHNACFVEED